ncbi:hypothetical protein ASD64_11425 [Mesorhizobium sp. Root157]|uniref:DUF5681 domain-containing protein n=1 Tax=Mesorhizobium sp. Root157 TaxID=1736477 RepID=UPI0006F9779C|nr:DUF5681 domain-containing protein [Mesorhizobium sp. Root157]KQZ80895.1 hypothetical protein ASD64_11425 [Mesorhizobium sp. Root157]
MTDDGEQPKDTRFKPGQSGNPKGRRAGTRSKALLALDALAEGEANKIAQAMIDKAKEGDTTAGRMLLERIWPVRKGRGISFELPEVAKADELPDAIAKVTRQVADGDISPDEGAAIVSLLEAHRRAIETSDLAARVEALEERMAKK